MNALPKIPILQIEHELKAELLVYDNYKSLPYNFLYAHVKIKVNIVLMINMNNTTKVKRGIYLVNLV